MKTPQLFFAIFISFIGNNLLSQEISFFNKCDNKQTIKYFPLSFNRGYIAQVKCKEQSYFFITKKKEDSSGILLGNANISYDAKIKSRKPLGPKYFIIYDPKNESFYRCDIESRNIVNIGRILHTGESNDTERP